MKRVSRRHVYTVVRDRLEAILCEPDDEALARVYEILTLDDCAPDHGSFIVEG